jgi:tripartite-type tricarboxylate transporter receptor subunit TctC
MLTQSDRTETFQLGSIMYLNRFGRRVSSASFAGLLTILFLTTFVGSVSAQEWPAKPVKIIVSTPAGGAPDILCRIIADKLSQAIGQNFIVDNRPGGANSIGSQAAARSAPDGYTLFFASAAALVSNPYTFKSLPYNPATDFVAVAKVAEGPFVFLANPNVGATTISEVIALEKKDPGKLAFVTDGKRSFAGMLVAWFNKLVGVNILQVPYVAMPQGVQDAVAGRVPLIVLALPIGAPFIASGALRPLAVSTSKRANGYEKIPSITETIPGLDFSGWFAFVAPAGTPPAIVQRANRAIDKVLKDPEIVSRFQTLGFYTDGADTPEGTSAYIKKQYELWATIVKEIGLEPE